MKWVCSSCSALNLEFRYSCYDCGVTNPLVGNRAPSEIVRQGKYECGAAALAILLGHTLFNVKSVLGEYGWRNDYQGVSESQLRACARAFGRDLVWCNTAMVKAMKKLPDSILTLESLNYKKRYHGVAYFKGEVIDPNFGDEARKYWFADADVEKMPIKGASVITKTPLSDFEFHEIERLRKSKHNYTAVDLVMEVAG